jgi:hypothetical protein
MKRIMLKNKIDKRFFCPFCKEDLRTGGIRFTENRIEYNACDNTAYYNDEGKQNDVEWGDSENTDSEGNGYGNYIYCNKCSHELAVNSDIIEELDLTEAWN